MHLHGIPLVVILLLVFVMEPSEAQRRKGFKYSPRNATITYTFRDPLTAMETVTAETGRYGINSLIANVSGRLVHVLTNDGGRDGCTTGVNLPSDGSDWIALIERGGCTFQTKINNHAVNHTASAVIVYNNEDYDLLVSMHVASNDVVSVFVNRLAGMLLSALLDLGGNVTIEITPTEPNATAPSFNSLRRRASSDVDLSPLYNMLVFVVIVCVVASLAGIALAVWKIHNLKLQRLLLKHFGGKADIEEEPVSNYKHLDETKN